MGDVHGCFDELQDLIEEVGWSPEDEWILVGDLLNKGPDSLGVLEWAKDSGARTLLGNHEGKLLSCLDKPHESLTSKERALLASLGESPQEFGDWIRTWPRWIEWPDLVAVHAGLEPGVSRLEAMRERIVLTVRTWDGCGEELDRIGDPAWYAVVDWPVPVVFGHWAAGGLVDLPVCKGLDTGCVYGGKLTAWSPDEHRFWQVPAHREWIPFRD
ncbi:MAG: metallophosphoesterase [Fibrobacteria bacterium]|nr:metallophosphoesterase [Fibrobacteria bacterium]